MKILVSDTLAQYLMNMEFSTLSLLAILWVHLKKHLNSSRLLVHWRSHRMADALVVNSKAGKVINEKAKARNWTSWMRLERLDQVNVGKEKPLILSRWERQTRNICRSCQDECCAGSVQTRQDRTMSAWLSQRRGSCGLNDLFIIASPGKWHTPIHRSIQSRFYHNNSTVDHLIAGRRPANLSISILEFLVRVREAKDMHTHNSIFSRVAECPVRFIAKAMP